MRPLLFLDVDGPLIPFGGDTREYFTPEDLPNPLLARVNPALGPLLSALRCDLIWATTWMEDANECVAPLLGLPELPVLSWPDSEDDYEARNGLHWKTRTIVARAAEHTFIWIDDEVTHVDRTWVTAHHAGPALLHRVEPDVGLTPDDLDMIADWLHAKSEQGPP